MVVEDDGLSDEGLSDKRSGNEELDGKRRGLSRCFWKSLVLRRSIKMFACAP